MLKRLLLLLSMAGGLLNFMGQSQVMMANHVELVQNTSYPQNTVNRILKEAAPQFNISYQDAHAAYTKGSLTIQQLAHTSNAYKVGFDGGIIWIMIEDN